MVYSAFEAQPPKAPGSAGGYLLRVAVLPQRRFPFHGGSPVAGQYQGQ